jgi:hypothetical protein
VAGKLEMSSVRPGVLPGGILSEHPVWRTVLPLQPS